MELESKFTGTPLRESRRIIRWRHTMNYAAAVDDVNEAYFDDERPGGIIAHPMNSVAITWPISERIWEYIDSDNFPKEILSTQVHFTEYLEFHRPVRPGDELVISGFISAILPHRAGTHVVMRFDAKDMDGKPVFTELSGALLRGVTCPDGGAGAESLPVIPRSEDGPVLWESEINVSPMLPFIYDGCTDIYFPIHTSKKFARQVGLPGIILQGTATLALAVREIVNREAGGDPSRLKKIYCNYTGMVLPGTDITVCLTGKNTGSAGSDVFFNVLNNGGQKAISRGYAEIL